MPEGPEIRRAADQVAAAIVGRRADRVWFGLPAIKRHGKALSGQRVIRVEPRGKALLTHFEGGRTLYTHNQLYGRWQVVKPGKLPRTSRSLRVAIENEHRWALLYSASDIEVLPTDQVNAHPYIARLGVELLDETIRLADVQRQVDDPRFARKSLAALLLDQGFLAGIGNYLRSEILYVARLRSEWKLGDLDEAGRARLAAAALDLTRQSYRTRGITNDLERAASLKAGGMSYGRYRHHVFDREGEPCWECGTRVIRRNLGGRAVFECGACQGEHHVGKHTKPARKK
ncbi:MAG: endonuclease VIII [Steroidobacteraceae bacterium]